MPCASFAPPQSRICLASSSSSAALQLKDRSRVWNTDLLEAVELENLLINAAITVHSAEQRKVRLWQLLTFISRKSACCGVYC